MTDAEVALRHEVIERLAYWCWERRGRPIASPEIDWRRAEEELADEESDLPFSEIQMGPETL